LIFKLLANVCLNANSPIKINPQMFILLISVNFVSLLLEAYVTDQYLRELAIESSSVDITRGILGLFIWIPYFLKSERVKSTFTKTYPIGKPALVVEDKINFDM